MNSQSRICVSNYIYMVTQGLRKVPACVQCEHPKNPLNCTVFNTAALAGISQVVAINAARHKMDSSSEGETVIPTKVTKID